jgi:hypothetical protein
MPKKFRVIALEPFGADGVRLEAACGTIPRADDLLPCSDEQLTRRENLWQDGCASRPTGESDNARQGPIASKQKRLLRRQGVDRITGTGLRYTPCGWLPQGDWLTV